MAPRFHISAINFLTKFRVSSDRLFGIIIDVDVAVVIMALPPPPPVFDGILDDTDGLDVVVVVIEDGLGIVVLVVVEFLEFPVVVPLVPPNRL